MNKTFRYCHLNLIQPHFEHFMVSSPLKLARMFLLYWASLVSFLKPRPKISSKIQTIQMKVLKDMIKIWDQFQQKHHKISSLPALRKIWLTTNYKTNHIIQFPIINLLITPKVQQIFTPKMNQIYFQYLSTLNQYLSMISKKISRSMKIKLKTKNK